MIATPLNYYLPFWFLEVLVLYLPMRLRVDCREFFLLRVGLAC